MKWRKLLLSLIVVVTASLGVVVVLDSTTFAAGPVKLDDENNWISGACEVSENLGDTNNALSQEDNNLYDCTGKMNVMNEIKDLDWDVAWCRTVSSHRTSGSGNSEWTYLKSYCWNDKEEAIDLYDESGIIESGEQNPNYKPVEGSNSVTAFDKCERQNLFGWIACSLAETVTSLVNILVNNFLLPMLQWRILV